jgi:polyisoprenoid-binding protein YceI
MLSFLGHSPTFLVRDFTGTVGFEADQVAGLRLELTIRAGSLELADQAKPSDRAEIEGRMRQEVLEVASYPTITFQSSEIHQSEAIARGRHRVRLSGPLSLHGVTQLQQMEAELMVFGDGIRLRGETALRMSDYRIAPVTALGGSIRLKDELRVSFDLAAVVEGP